MKKDVLEKIAAGSCAVELVGEFFILCHDLHNLADLEGQRRKLARDTLRYQQNGRCIFPNCKKGRQLHLHHCLASYLGGDSSADNCVLVCAQHHPELEQFRNKAEVEEYLSKGAKA